MYEFDEQRWDQQQSESGDLKGIAEGWLIQRVPHASGLRNSTADHHSFPQAMYLQIGTGQWCWPDHATLFPLRRTAVVYAKEFGYVVGRTVEIVKHRF